MDHGECRRLPPDNFKSVNVESSETPSTTRAVVLMYVARMSAARSNNCGDALASLAPVTSVANAILGRGQYGYQRLSLIYT